MCGRHYFGGPWAVYNIVQSLDSCGEHLQTKISYLYH